LFNNSHSEEDAKGAGVTVNYCGKGEWLKAQLFGDWLVVFVMVISHGKADAK